MINETQQQLLTTLFKKKQTVKDLANFLNISPRLVYKNIKILNDFFNDFFTIKKIDKFYELELFVNKNDFFLMLDSYTNLSQEQRRFYLTFKLLTEQNFNLKHECAQLNISRTTIKADLTFIKEYVKLHNLNLEFNKNKYYITENKSFSQFLFLLKNFYLFLKNKSLPLLHKNYIKELIQNINLKELQEKTFKILKKYFVTINSDIINYILSYQIISKLKNIFFVGESNSYFLKDFIHFFNNHTQNNSTLLLTPNKILLEQINLDSNLAYTNFLSEVSKYFFLENLKLTKKEKILFFKNLNFLILKNYTQNCNLDCFYSNNKVYSIFENIFKELYKIQIPPENYCFFFLLQNIILQRKIKKLKSNNILLFIDSLNKELCIFLKKEIYNKFKINSIIFDTKQELITYLTINPPPILIVTNEELSVLCKSLKYSPGNHYSFFNSLEEFLLLSSSKLEGTNLAIQNTIT